MNCVRLGGRRGRADAGLGGSLLFEQELEGADGGGIGGFLDHFGEFGDEGVVVELGGVEALGLFDQNVGFEGAVGVDDAAVAGGVGDEALADHGVTPAADLGVVELVVLGEVFPGKDAAAVGPDVLFDLGLKFS